MTPNASTSKEDVQKEDRKSTEIVPWEDETFDANTTPSWKAIEHWALATPDRTAMVYTNSMWRVKKGKPLNRTVDPKDWHRINYKDFDDKVTRLRAGLHQIGVPTTGNGNYRVIILFLPPTRVDLIATIMALQATGCVILYGYPKPLGGLRGWAQAMLSLEPDAILCTRTVRKLFQFLASTTKSPKREKKMTWLNAKALMKYVNDSTKQGTVPKVTPLKGLTLDSPAVIMFSSGTTGYPTPIQITHRMFCFQAAGYVELVRRMLGEGRTTDKAAVSESPASPRDGPWLSVHFFPNFSMIDLHLGGTALLQPMGTQRPAETVCPMTLRNIIQSFQAKVVSASPALWNNLRKTCADGELSCVQVGVVGGAETCATFARECEKLIKSPTADQDSGESGFLRVYASTQVLPISYALANEIVDEEEKRQMCVSGCGVCLGQGVAGLDFVIDKAAWESKGGRSQLALPDVGTVEVGEICICGKAVSPSEEVMSEVETAADEPPTRMFHSGDIGYLDPVTGHIHFLGRKAQAVDCGGDLGMVAPAGVEMVCLEANAVPRCAFVGVPRGNKILPVLVVQLDGEDPDMTGVKKTLREAIEKSVWSELLSSGLCTVVYPKEWPVDQRHSSKINRFLLRDWAAKLDEQKLVTV